MVSDGSWASNNDTGFSFCFSSGPHCVLLGGGWGSWRGAMGVCDLPCFLSDSEEQVETVLWACVDPVELSLRLLGQSLLMDSSGV